jgi:hypothetical protein
MKKKLEDDEISKKKTFKNSYHVKQISIKLVGPNLKCKKIKWVKLKKNKFHKLFQIKQIDLKITNCM